MSSSYIGQNLKKIRKYKGWTQQELANKIGINLQNLSKIERGVNHPTFQTLEKIMQTLEVTPNELFAENFKVRGVVENELIQFMERERAWNIEMERKKYEGEFTKEEMEKYEIGELRKYIKAYIDADHRHPSDLHPMKEVIYEKKLAEVVGRYDEYLSYDLFGETLVTKDKHLNPYKNENGNAQAGGNKESE
ncbi:MULTISPECIES: helix-turn-helix domain-containing protein [Gracilibacillus]|uniref:helix-turn-helix domain-containing protein n=1 Tax=Gracilibacillus TaxID=74385 RepID=UPI000825BA8B|nr:MULTISPECIES: helix-turn-helix transcriptional regulator [Gracilibacillus]